MTGSLRERPEGSNRWELRASVGRDFITGHYHQASRIFHGSRKQAEKALAKLVTEVDSGKVTYENCTVGQLCDRWIAHLERRGRAPNTLRNYRWLAKRVLAEFGTQQVRRVTPAQLDAFYGQVQNAASGAKHDGRQTADHMHRMLRAMFNQGIKWGLLDKSPTDRASGVRPAPVEPEVLDPVLIGHLISAAGDTDMEFACLIYVAGATGLRRGELCGLRWSDIDFDDGYLLVQRAVSGAKGEIHVREPKTGKGRRLSMGASLATVFEAQRREAWRRCQSIGVDLAPDAYVWSHEDDYSQPLKPDSVTGTFRRLCKREGVEGARFHYLRHFGISLELASGVDVKTVSVRAGHSSPTLTLTTYAHVIKTADQHAADVVEAALTLPQAAALLAGILEKGES